MSANNRIVTRKAKSDRSRPDTSVEKSKPCKVSWWTAFAQPDQFQEFSEAWRIREAQKIGEEARRMNGLGQWGHGKKSANIGDAQ